MPIYCDESGFTGDNMLDKDQPYFSYASVNISEDEAEEKVNLIKKKYNIRLEEIKGKVLLSRSDKYKKAVGELFIDLLNRTKITFAEKKYSIACSFFEHIFLPLLDKKISLFYDNNLDKYIIYTIYTYIKNNDEMVEDMLLEFEKFIHRKESSLLSFDISNDNNKKLIYPIIELALLHKDKIIEKFQKLNDLKYILDKSAPLFYYTICAWTDELENIKVICDESKPLEYFVRLFNDIFINRKDQVRKTINGINFPLIPHLSEPISFGKSKNIPGLQLADIMASVTTYIAKNIAICPYAQEWHSLISPHVYASIIPGNDYPHNSKLETVRSIVILEELVKRSRQNQDLLDRIEEKFLFADAFAQVYMSSHASNNEE